MSDNEDVPVVVVRRRRRIVRHHVREKTPEPTAKSGGIKQKYSDDESSSTAETTNNTNRQDAVSGGSKVQRTHSASTTTSTASAGTTMSSHRTKILSRRDKGVGTSAVRSQSTPREPGADGSTLKKDLIPKPVKRSLSSPRHKEELFQPTAPPRHFERETAPPREIPDKNTPQTNENDENSSASNKQELTKLERNLKRFEEERCKFDLEKRQYEKEREQERSRCKRLVEFERKRMARKLEEEKMQEQQKSSANDHATLYSIMRVIEDSKTHLPSILKSEKLNETNTDDLSKPIPPPRRIDVPTLDFIEPPESPDICDDYESSTAISSSSREGDFDDVDFTALQEPIKIEEPEPLTVIQPTSNGTKTTAPVPIQSKPNEDTTKPTTIPPIKQSFLSKLFGRKPPGQTIVPVIIIEPSTEPVSFSQFFFVETRLIWRKLIADHPDEWLATVRMRNKCIADLIILSIFCGTGGLLFRFVEGAFENFYKCGVRRVKRDFVDHLWHTSHNLREDDWKSMARKKLRMFEEELHAAHEAGMTSYSGMKAWTFLNSVIYCLTVVTTIGYGHIYPSTNTGRAVTIVYAIIGIPMFLILLADFGKLFTRGIKFIWAYVRRLYYTGSLRKVRKQAQVQEVLRGMNMAYEIATFRRPSVFSKEEDLENPPKTPSSSNLAPPLPNETPTTPVPTEIDIDDEFNLPISLAFIILLAYIFCGAAVYSLWEEWSFFESCYFVFISMSTIGFGDYVPKHPMYMMTSIIYLVFGLALTSMCINVVQVKLSDSFRMASAKIGATIGLSMAEEEARKSENVTPAVATDDTVPVHRHSTIISDNNKGATETTIPNIKTNNDEDVPPPLLPKKKNSLIPDDSNSSKESKKSKKKDKK